MRIKRIFAANTREALRKVKELHGPDAVVLSSRSIDGGVEVISAIDYDEQAVRAAAQAQDPRAAEIPPLEGAPGPRPGAPDAPLGASPDPHRADHRQASSGAPGTEGAQTAGGGRRDRPGGQQAVAASKPSPDREWLANPPPTSRDSPALEPLKRGHGGAYGAATAMDVAETGEDDEGARARRAALARLRRLRADGVADDALPRSGAGGGGAALMERPGLPGPADATDPGRINVRVGGDEEEEAELFAALSREHGERERERAERPRPRGGERRRPGGQGGGEQATERRAVAPLLFGQQGAAAPRADASVAPDRKKSGLWTETGEAQAEAAPWAQHANAERAGERVATASAGWAREETRARGGAVPRRGRANEDPALQQMRDELRTLRTLFENQLSMLEWGRMGHRHPARAAVIKRLAELGLGADVSRRLADHIGSDDPPDSAFRKALALIARNLPVAGDEIVERGGVVALVGPTGVGKTTTVAKLAARYALRHGREKVALVSTDNYRVGAQDQLLTYARILDVPVYTATNRHELRNVVDDLSGRGLVLIDTVGMSQRDVRLAEQFKTLGSGEGLVRTFLVLSAATQLSTLTESVSAFSGAAPVGCILTKVDEATTLGGALTCALRTRLPLAYLTTGQRVPEDLQAARGDILVHRACALLDEHKQEPDEETLALSLGGGAHVSE